MARAPVPFYLVAGRIVAFLGMGFSSSLGLFLLLGGFWLAGFITLAFLLVSLGLLYLVEWLAERHLRRGAPSR